MVRLVYHVNAGLLGLGVLSAGCTAILGIDKDYREGDGGAGGGVPGTGSGGAAQSSAASSSSGSGAEDCFNNQDDDGNQQTDCQDPACGGVAQCADVPAGWTVIRATQVGDPSTPPGTCADGSTPQTVYFTQPGGPATCSQCQCTLAAGTTCTAPQITCYYSTNACAGGSSTVHQLANTACFDLPNVPNNNIAGSCKLSGAATLQSGMCSTSGGTQTTSPMWGGAVFVCDAPSSSGGCLNGQSCVPTGASPDGPVCIKKDGTDPCPMGWMNTISAFTSGTDSRSCSGCQCAVGCTGGSYVVHDNGGCMNLDPPVNITQNSCKQVPAIFDYGTASLRATLATASVASCTGGQPQGQVTGTGPVTICCK